MSFTQSDLLAENQTSPAKTATIPSIFDSIEIIAIDTETTGLNPDKDEIIEIAAVKFIHGVKTDVFNCFIKPRKEVPHYIEYLTHITPADLKNAPGIEQVIPRLKAFLGDSVIVGQNTKFDLDFINNQFIRHNELPLLNKWWDTGELGRIYLPYTSNHKLGTMCEHFGISLENAHRAIDDATATGELFHKLVEYASGYFSVIVNTRILELSIQSQPESNLTSLLEIITNYQRKYSLIGNKPHTNTSQALNILENKCLNPKVFTQEEIFKQNGVLNSNFEQYEFRAGQLDMAESTEEAFVNNNYLVVEAGTGVGKSFAYLIPALQFSYNHQKKVVVSTNTKNLQEQLFAKDLPVLKKILQIPFKAVLIKGRDNYICERKWEELLTEQTRGLTPYEASAMLHLLIWKLNTQTGDVTENSSFDKSRFNIFWYRLCSDRHTCAGRKCQFFTRCFVMKLRKAVDDANLIVANHSLLLADLKSDHASLGEYEYLIIDEAHNIMQTATKQLGIELGYVDIINQLNQLSKVYRKKNIAFIEQIDRAINKSVLGESVKDQIRFISHNLEELIENKRQVIQGFFIFLGEQCEATDSFGKLRIKAVNQLPELFSRFEEIINFWKNLRKEIHALHNVFSTINSKQMPAYDIIYERIQEIDLRAFETEEELLKLLNPDLEDYAMWIEAGQKTDRNVPGSMLCLAPIEVDYHLNNIVYKNVPCIVFTSATMALRNSFKFFLNQSGLALVEEKRVIEKVVESPFDYAGQSRLLVAGFLPEPSDKYFQSQALDLMDLIFDTAPVGTLTLFTSYKDLDAAYNKLNEKLYQNNRPLFAQGKWSSRSALLDEFKKHNNAVLLGTSSFWEGIDVQGESLSLLILFKLPFQVPSEPIVEAYIDKLEKSNRDSFMHYILPNALLRLRQGFGRLIRSKTDTGVVIIIDPRVTTKRYGHFFQEVLPASSRVMNDPLQMQSSISDFYKKRHSIYKKGD